MYNHTAEDHFEELLESDQNDPEIQYQIGLCYQNGQGVEQNGVQALQWLRRAAEQNHKEAQTLLERTEGGSKSQAKAVTEDTLPDWCLAAEEGDPEAQYQVAMYFAQNPFPGSPAEVRRYLELASDQGHGKACLSLAWELLNLEPERAVQLLRNAADCGEPEALETLGECYAQGRGVEQDPQKAEQFFIQWANLGNAETKLALALRYKKGNGVSKSLGRALSWLKRAQLAGMDDASDRFYAEEREEAAQAVQDQERFAALLAQAQEGDTAAQNDLGSCYESGCGVVQNYAQAVHWYSLAAARGNAQAQYHLGSCYCDGRGVEQDYTQAIYWYQQAAQQGLGTAQCRLGYCYYNGRGVEQDYAQAVRWYQLAAQQGIGKALHSLGYCYYNGLGVDQDYSQAVHWYQLAAQQGIAAAQNNLGVCYALGRGVGQDYEQAVHWYRLAAQQGEPWAQNNLGSCYQQGQGVGQNNTQAIYWYRKAADQGHKEAQERLAALSAAEESGGEGE